MIIMEIKIQLPLHPITVASASQRLSMVTILQCILGNPYNADAVVIRFILLAVADRCICIEILSMYPQNSIVNCSHLIVVLMC